MSKKTKTEAMFEAKSPYSNMCQGLDRKVLFVCSAGILRSATAARIYAPYLNTRAAGSKNFALIPVTDELLLWADEVVFVNKENYQDVSFRFDLDTFDCNVVVLNIPDDYNHMDEELIQHFKKQYGEDR